MQTVDFDFIRKFIQEHSAIVLESGKEYLVETRLTPLVKPEGFNSLDELIQNLRSKPFGVLHRKVIDAMTTNETLFFRDIYPFEALKKTIIPELITKRAAEKKLYIWCGAASSGQEPYSLLLLLKETFPQLIDWNIVFIATDISESMLERARNGIYNQFEVNRGLPITYLVKYFEKSGSEWKLKDDLRKIIDFRKMNLVGDWPLMPNMDLIFVRNVLIYFDVATKKSILGKARAILKPDGYLFLGGGESTFGIDDAYERLEIDKAVCYRLKKKA